MNKKGRFAFTDSRISRSGEQKVVVFVHRPATEIADIIDRCPSKALQYELLNPISVVFEDELDRAAAYDRGKLIGECEFEASGDRWVIMHTGVREAYEGKGIARKLVLKVVETARSKDIKILPVCSYAKKLMTGKEEFKDVM